MPENDLQIPKRTIELDPADISPPTRAPYVELGILSCFSFLRGASHPEELVEQAAKLGYRGIAITDECSFAGLVKAHLAAKDHDIQLIIGAEFHLEEGIHLVLLAPDRARLVPVSLLVPCATCTTFEATAVATFALPTF